MPAAHCALAEDGGDETKGEAQSADTVTQTRYHTAPFCANGQANGRELTTTCSNSNEAERAFNVTHLHTPPPPRDCFGDITLKIWSTMPRGI